MKFVQFFCSSAMVFFIIFVIPATAPEIAASAVPAVAAPNPAEKTIGPATGQIQVNAAPPIIARIPNPTPIPPPAATIPAPSITLSKDILDIGACHGVYSIELTKNNKFNHAYAFEANKIYSRIIGINTILNNVVDKVDIINTYISNKNDKINYNGWSNNNENIDTSALASECYERTSYDNNYDQFKEVSTRTIDSYNLSNIGFIKIDVEGHELEVLQGALKTIILNDYPPILFEIWDIEKPFIINKEEFISYKNKIITLLESLGYEIQFNVDYDTHLAICKKKVD